MLPCRLCTAVRVPAVIAQSLRRTAQSTGHKTNVELTVSYSGHTVENGSNLLPSAASKQPHVSYTASETYALMLLDPDAPAPDKPMNRNL